jgi:hypothetical protein
MPRGIPNRKPLPSASIDDDDDAGQPVRSHVQAGSQPPPATTAASSVFALGRQARPAPTKRTTIDAAAVPIRSNVPIPPSTVGGNAESPYAALLRRMQPGDMVELPYRQGYGLLSMAKKLGIKVTRRTLSVGVLSIWRT